MFGFSFRLSVSRGPPATQVFTPLVYSSFFIHNCGKLNTFSYLACQMPVSAFAFIGADFSIPGFHDCLSDFENFIMGITSLAVVIFHNLYLFSPAYRARTDASAFSLLSLWPTTLLSVLRMMTHLLPCFFTVYGMSIIQHSARLLIQVQVRSHLFFLLRFLLPYIYVEIKIDNYSTGFTDGLMLK